MAYLKFLYQKLRGYSLFSLIRLECESLVLGLCSLIPTVLGVFIRAIVYKMFFKKINGFPWVQPGVTFVHSDRITVGQNLGINTGTYINGVGGIELGNYVLIGNNVTISSGMHPINGVLPTIFSRPIIQKKIIIQDDVWIAAGAVIMPGITLAKGCVIGANAVVIQNTQPYGIYAGSPAKKIGDREERGAC